MSVADVKLDEKIQKKVSEPERYKVIFLNDNQTPMEFVVELLRNIFKHSESSSQELTMKIHQEGSAIVGVYSYEIAEQKGTEATNASRSHGFPLQIKIEKE
jgi:ATP-dependent Clp protease adaptor protein ClpS